MKHTIKVTVLLLLLFFLSQCTGLFVISQYIDYSSSEDGNVTYSELPFQIERPEMDESFSFIYIFLMILLGTIIVLVIIKFKQIMVWKIWFLFSVVVCLTISLGSFMPQYMAIALAIIIAIFKVFKPNVLIHNFSEIFMYSAIAAIFVPMLNLFSVTILLILISIYDYIAVYKIQHMVTLADFQGDNDVFAGLKLSYGKNKILFKTPISKSIKANAANKFPKITSTTKTTKASKTNNIDKSAPIPPKKNYHSAVLGGGDIAFPLLFIGVVFQKLLFIYPLSIAIIFSVILIITVTGSLAYLLLAAKKNKYYPAMPFISAGCFLGFGFVWLFSLLL